ncbi:MAG: DUF389 domain-containing protein [Luteibaculum sp.]
MSNQPSQENSNSQEKELKNVGLSLKSLFQSFLNIFKGTFNIREGAEVKATTEGIKRDISFKGHNSWILVFSIFIASIGLNVNSIPVIIGAMLISPLMGPILGLGLAVATNDWETLTRSLKNFGIMILIALATSTLYFTISPLSDLTSELLNRVKPTLLDVFIAVFGGFAGIVAGSRKEKSNVVPGVAIATALMPPLCTAGFGLAYANSSMFFGAMYLFLLNSVFICISTYIVIRYLKFPLKEFVDTKKEKQIRYSIAVFVAVVIIPSGFIFYDVIKETIFNRNANNFLGQEVFYEGTEVINQKVKYDKEEGKIDVFLIGERVPAPVIEGWKKKLSKYDLEGTVLEIHQSKDETGEIAGKLSEQVRSGIISDLYERNEAILASKDEKIAFLEQELTRLSQVDSLPVAALFSEAKVNYPWVNKIQGGNLQSYDGNVKDSRLALLVYYNTTLTSSSDSLKFLSWTKVRLNSPDLNVVFIPKR